MPPLRRLEKGAVLAARYEILRQLGATRMSEVFEAWDRKLEEKVAVKILRAASTDTEARARLRQEVRLARKVHHKNVGAIHDCGEDGDLEFISMELVEGQDLRHVLEARRPFDWDRAYTLILEIGEGLAAVHDAGIIHRDLKPANIMVEPSGHPRVMDFGIAKAESGSQPGTTGEGTVKGTPEYMSPEQVRGRGIDLRSDLYAFGVVIFEVFTSRVPFRAETPVLTMLKHIEEPPPLDPAPVSLPSALVPVLRRALAKDAGERFTSCPEMLAALREAWAQLETDKDLPIPQEGSGDRKTEAIEVKRRLRPSTALPEETRLLVPMLTRALSNAQSEVRLAAARALALQGPGAAVAIDGLRALLRDPIAEVQAEAAAALRAVEPAVSAQPGAPPPPAPTPALGARPTPPPVRAGPTSTLQEASSGLSPGATGARDAATQAALDTPEALAEPSFTPPTKPPSPPVPPSPLLPPVSTPAPRAVDVPAPREPEPPPLAPRLPVIPHLTPAPPHPPLPAPQPPSVPAKVIESRRDRTLPAAARPPWARLPPWLLMLAVATGVLGLGRLLMRQSPPVEPPALSTTVAPSGAGEGAGEAILPGTTPPSITSPPTTLAAQVAMPSTTTTRPPGKAAGTTTTLAVPPTTVPTTTTTMATPTTTTLEAVPPTTLPAELESVPLAAVPESTTTTTLAPLKPPECVSCPSPPYPEIALAARKQGTVELRLRVDETGRVVDVQVLKGDRVLAEAAVKSARGRVYRPASRGGVPEAATVNVPIEFKLPK